MRSMAAVLAVGDDAALSKGSAGFSLGLRKAPATVMEVLIPHTRRV